MEGKDPSSTVVTISQEVWLTAVFSLTEFLSCNLPQKIMYIISELHKAAFPIHTTSIS